MGTTYKVCLTKEQWERVCKRDEEVAVELAKQQPELGTELGYELVTSVQRTLAKKPVEAAGAAGSAGEESEDSPVSDSNAAEAIDSIQRMRSKDRLQHVIDNDKRATVQDAARKRLEELNVS